MQHPNIDTDSEAELQTENDISNLDLLMVKAVGMTATRLLSQITRSRNAVELTAMLVALLCLSIVPLNQVAFAQSTSSPPVTVKTDNNSVSVIINWTPKEIQAGKNVDISLEFQNPSSGQTLSHVNYNLKIIDPSGKTVKSIDGIHTHSGKDVQTVKLDKMGDFTLEIIVIGLGLNKPFDTSMSGTARTAIVVVPEFPFTLAALAIGFAIVAIAARSKYSNLPRFPTRKQQS